MGNRMVRHIMIVARAARIAASLGREAKRAEHAAVLGWLRVRFPAEYTAALITTQTR